jgi:BirA family biotin operon repressor/biotin-[acetyl-CoA-carboxylase] ligase
MYTDLDRPPLPAAALRRSLVLPESLWTQLTVVERTGSTNADLAALAREGAPEGVVLVAESQERGRGRLGRDWVSPPRAGLTVSVLLRPTGVPLSRWGWLPLLTGVALARAVGRLAEVQASLKWPNDLLLGPERRKAAGVLAELTNSPAAASSVVTGPVVTSSVATRPEMTHPVVAGPEMTGPAVVIGVGLNVTTTAAELPRADATSLRLEGAACIDRVPLLQALLRELAADYLPWREAGGDPRTSGLRAAYLKSCDTLGRQVQIALPSEEVLAGEAVGVDDEGRLLVRPGIGGLPVAVAAGDVVHVR